jgi:glycosyltransferase involved in cell wall biosynthesis
MVSIIVCTYNRQEYLKIALKSILDQKKHNLIYEVIIIDNNSPDNTKQVALNFISEHPEINSRYILETRQGISYTRSRGFEESKYKYVAYSDDDAYYSPDYFHELEKLINNNPTIKAFGGKVLLDYEEGKPPKWETKYLSSILGYFNKGEVEHFLKNDYARGANMVFTKDLIKSVGAFNFELGRTGGDMNGGEEKDIAEKIYKKGEKVLYSPKLIVYHAVPIFRTKNDFVKKQALGIGYSERVLALSKDKLSLIKRILIEVYKWGGSIALFFIYLIKAQPAKGIMILKFRWWVSKGLFFG